MHPIWRPLWDGRGEGEEWPFVERKEEEDEANDSENVIINSPFQTRKGETTSLSDPHASQVDGFHLVFGMVCGHFKKHWERPHGSHYLFQCLSGSYSLKTELRQSQNSNLLPYPLEFLRSENRILSNKNSNLLPFQCEFG